MKNTNTAIATLAPVSAVQPKPTKTEILNAMVARAKVKYDEENIRRATAREALEKKIEALAIKAMKNFAPTVYIYSHTKPESCHCDIRVSRVKSPELDALLLNHQELSRLHWDEKETRDAIRQQLSGRTDSRLLENPEAVKAIDAMLEQWGI